MNALQSIGPSGQIVVATVFAIIIGWIAKQLDDISKHGHHHK
jgi:hypothetical protein